MKRVLTGLLLATALVPALAIHPATQAPRLAEDLFATLTWRNLGPVRTGAWTTAIAVPDTPVQAHLYTFYVGTRNGGVWPRAPTS